MAQILYDTTKGYIVGVFLDTETVGTLPAGYAIHNEVGVDPIEFINKQIDISGPSVKTRDYLTFTGLDTQGVSTVAVHGVAKFNGATDAALTGVGDNELGDTNGTPITAEGFLEDPEDKLSLGAATTRLASGAIAGGEYLHVDAGFLGKFKKIINYT